MEHQWITDLKIKCYKNINSGKLIVRSNFKEAQDFLDHIISKLRNLMAKAQEVKRSKMEVMVRWYMPKKHNEQKSILKFKDYMSTG